MNTVFKIIEHNSPQYLAAVDLRDAVLRRPIGLAFNAQELDLENNHIHIAGFNGEDMIATAVLVPKGKICKMQRVAVSPDARANGIGSQMMRFCETYAASQGFTEIYCNARDTAVTFYLKNNYQPEGHYFEEVTIQHLKMRKIIQ